jgi:hypothetical protein
MVEDVMQLKRGDVVKAVSVPASVCSVRVGELGVVFDDEGGRAVRWVNSLTTCNVQGGWVKLVKLGM